MGKCQYCGFIIKKGGSICPECNKHIKIQIYSDKNSTNKLAIRTILGVFFIIMFLVVGVFNVLFTSIYLNNSNTDESDENCTLSFNNMVYNGYNELDCYINGEFERSVQLAYSESQSFETKYELGKKIKVIDSNNKSLFREVELRGYNISFSVLENSINVMELYNTGDFSVSLGNLMDENASVEISTKDEKEDTITLKQYEAWAYSQRYSTQDRIEINITNKENLVTTVEIKNSDVLISIYEDKIKVNHFEDIVL